MDNLFLTLTLFFPRLTLLVYYLKGWMPLNDVPFWGDVLMGVFVPRVLVLVYIYQNLGTGSAWFWVHLVFLLLTWGTGGSTASRRRSRD